MKYLTFYTNKIKMTEEQYDSFIDLYDRLNLNKKYEVDQIKIINPSIYKDYSIIDIPTIINTDENFNLKLNNQAYYRAYRSKLFNFLKPIIQLRDVGPCIITGNNELKDIHHIDKNPMNNNPRNLIAISSTAHYKLHYNKISFDFGVYIESVEDKNSEIDKVIEEFNRNYNNKFKI